MTTFSRQFATEFALVAMQAGIGSAQDEAKPDAVEPVQAAKPTRAELRDKQLDVSLEARDIERILGKLKKASELSKQRITEAAKVAESASMSLDKGDSKAARAEAQQTAEMFKEIAKQLEALLKEEAPQRIAEARQMAQQLAKAEKEFAEKFQGALNPTQATSGKGKIDPKSQVQPLTDPDGKKMQGSQGKAQKGGGGKNGKKNEDDKNAEKKDPDGKTGDDKNGEKPKPKTGDADQPRDKGTEPRKDGKNGGDKPMPDGQGGGKPDDKNKGDEQKLGPGNTPDDSKEDGKDGDKKKPAGGSGKEPGDKPNGGGAGKGKDEAKDGDEQKPGGSDSAKNEKGEKKPGEDQDGSGGDKPNDKQRDASGGGSGKDQMKDKDRHGGDGAALTPEQLREMVADRADKMAESGRTLQDVLNEIAKSSDPNDKDAVAKIQAVMKEIDINKIVAEMSQVSNMIRSKQDDDAKLSSLDVSERLEIMAQRLDAAYRGIVAPQDEELRKLEQALADLREQLEKLETPSQVAAWHREARELLDKLDKLGVNLKAREELELEMKRSGFGVGVDRAKRTLDWSLVDGRYDAPATYTHALVHLQEDIQERIQTLILGDLGNVSDEATPPKYQEFVERYYEVLSRQGGKAGKSENSTSRGQQQTPVGKP